MLDRSWVYEVLDIERDYQLLRWGIADASGSLREETRTVEAYILYMQDYLNEAAKDITRNSGTGKALDTLRKVATLAIACFEQHGVPDRQPQIVVNAHDQVGRELK